MEPRKDRATVSTRRKWGSVKEAVAALATLPAPQIVKQTGISRYSVYHAARRMGLRLPSPYAKK
jgi:hypothetical protein